MNVLDLRFRRLFRRHTPTEDLGEQLADLRHVINSMAQDMAVLQEMLGECWPGGVADCEAQYRWRRAARMTIEHGRSGKEPEFAHRALFAHTLEEEDFLRLRLRASPTDLAYVRKAIGRQDTLS
jgi:hypothetical protein